MSFKRGGDPTPSGVAAPNPFHRGRNFRLHRASAPKVFIKGERERGELKVRLDCFRFDSPFYSLASSLSPPAFTK